MGEGGDQDLPNSRSTTQQPRTCSPPPRPWERMSASVHAAPPAVIPAVAILPENLPDAWAQGDTTALVVSTALPQKVGKTLPWKRFGT